MKSTNSIEVFPNEIMVKKSWIHYDVYGLQDEGLDDSYTLINFRGGIKLTDALNQLNNKMYI